MDGGGASSRAHAMRWRQRCTLLPRTKARCPTLAKDRPRRGTLNFCRLLSLTGDWKFNPAKSFTYGAQALFGVELGWNSDLFKQALWSNMRCGYYGSSH